MACVDCTCLLPHSDALACVACRRGLAQLLLCCALHTELFVWHCGCAWWLYCKSSLRSSIRLLGNAVAQTVSPTACSRHLCGFATTYSCQMPSGNMAAMLHNQHFVVLMWTDRLCDVTRVPGQWLGVCGFFAALLLGGTAGRSAGHAAHVHSSIWETWSQAIRTEGQTDTCLVCRR